MNIKKFNYFRALFSFICIGVCVVACSSSDRAKADELLETAKLRKAELNKYSSLLVTFISLTAGPKSPVQNVVQEVKDSITTIIDFQLLLLDRSTEKAAKKVLKMLGSSLNDIVDGTVASTDEVSLSMGMLATVVEHLSKTVSNDMLGPDVKYNFPEKVVEFCEMNVVPLLSHIAGTLRETDDFPLITMIPTHVFKTFIYFAVRYIDSSIDMLNISILGMVVEELLKPIDYVFNTISSFTGGVGGDNSFISQMFPLLQNMGNFASNASNYRNTSQKSYSGRTSSHRDEEEDDEHIDL